MIAVKVATTTTESSCGEEDEEEEEIEMTNLVESKVDSSDDDVDDDDEEEELIIVDGLTETAVDDEDVDDDDEEDDEVELDVDDDNHVVNVTDDCDDEEVFVVPDTVSNQSSTESTVSTDNQYFTLSDLLDLITGISPGVTDHLMEEFLVAYKFLLTDSRLTHVLPQLNQGGCQCDQCKSNPTKLLVRHLIQRSCSFDLLLRLTLVWVNCFFNDFDGNFNYTRKILVRLKQIQLYQSHPQIQPDVNCQPLPSHPPPPLDKMDSDVEDDADGGESEDTFDFDDIESDTTPRIESSLDLVSLALSLKSTVRRASVSIDLFSCVTFDLGIESNHPSASSGNLQASSEAIGGSINSTLCNTHGKQQSTKEECLSERKNISLSCSNGLDTNESTIRLVFDPITGRVFIATNVRDINGTCGDSIILREGDRLIAIDDIEISYTSLSNSPELEFKAVRELESKIANYIKGLSDNSSHQSCASNLGNKSVVVRIKYDPFAYNAILKRIKKRKLICNKRHSISSSISSYSTGYHSSVASVSRLTHPHFHSAGHHNHHTHHSHHHHHHHHNTAHASGATHSSSSSPSASMNHIASSSSVNNSYQNHHHQHTTSQGNNFKTELQALQIFNAFKDGREHLLLVDERKTNAREVVMILARDLFLSAASSLNTNSSFDQIRRKASLAALLSPSSAQSNSSNTASGHQTVAGLSSLDFALYELTVSYASGTGVIVRSRRISDTATNLWSSRSIFSRLLLKQIARNSSVISSANFSTNEDDDGDSNSFENRIRKELVESYLKVKNKKSKVSNDDEEYNPISLTDVEPMSLALELTYHAYRLFSALDAQSILSSILVTSPGGTTSSNTNVHNNVHQNSYSRAANSSNKSCSNLNAGKNLRNADDFICASKEVAGLEAWESLTEAEMFWAINEILRQSTSEDRVKCVKILIKTALICLLKLRNFSTAASITSALEHASIKRLKKTLWQPLKKKHKNLNDDLTKLNQVLDPSKNMAFYRRSVLEAVAGKFDRNRQSQSSNDKVAATGGTLLSNSSLTVDGPSHTRHRSLSATGHSLFNDLRSSMTKSKTNSNSSGSVNNNAATGEAIRKIVIPWYPVHKKDLTFYHITQDTLDKSDATKINWTKIRAIVSKLRELLSYSCESPSSNSKSFCIDDTSESDSLYRKSTSIDSSRCAVNNWYEPVPRRSYPYIEVINEYKHPMTLPNDSNEQSKDLAKRVHSFMCKEKLTKEFLHNSFFKPNCILFNEELLMKKSLDLENAPVSSSSTNATRSSNSNRTINVNVNIPPGNSNRSSSSSVVISSHKQGTSQTDTSAGSLVDLKRGKINSTHDQSSVPTLESMNCNFHGILSGPMKHSTGPIGRTIPTSKFGVTDESQLNKLLSLTSNSSSSKSSGKSGKHHSHNHHHHHHHHHYHASHSHAHSNTTSSSSHQHPQQQSQQQAQQTTSSSQTQLQQQQQQHPQPQTVQQQYPHHVHSNSQARCNIDQSILAPNALYPAQSSSSSSSTCSSTSLHHPYANVTSSSALTYAMSPVTQATVAVGGHRTVTHKPCSHHSTDRLSRESSSLGPAFRYPESAHLPPLATARTTSTASVTQQPRQSASSQTIKGSIMLSSHHHRHLQQNIGHHRHYNHPTVTSSSASSTRDSSPLALFGHTSNIIETTIGSPNSSDINRSIDSTQMLPSYEETIANLRSLRVTPTVIDTSSINVPSTANNTSTSSRQRSTSCPRRTTHSRRENLV